MLTEEDRRNGLIIPPSHWPNKTVPFATEVVFSEYCNTKFKVVFGAWREISLHYEYSFSSSTHCRLLGRSNGDKYITFPHKTLTNSHSKAAIYTHPKPSYNSKIKFLGITKHDEER
jgi:hypothetical protein